jgi:hypothetical protein
MTEQSLAGHLGTTVAIDLCLPCQTFWFDERENLQLTPGSTLRLFKLIGDRASAPTTHATSSSTTKCPRCNLRLVPVHDIQRTTRFVYERCPARHGRLISFVDFLREKNFIKPLSAEQIARLREHVQTVNCSNCGAPIDLAQTTTCGHCGSPLSMLDFEQAGRLVSDLQRAERTDRVVDPTLPLQLERARREVESSFATFDQNASWYDDVSASGLIGAGLRAISKWMGT